MIISLSDSTSAQRMTQFYTAHPTLLRDVIPLITRHAWSPCVWSNGTRLEANFMFADFCALDFDDGRMSIDDAKDVLETADLAGLIGTTRSHQKEKDGKPAVDRFRMVMPWRSRITDLATYRQNMDRLIKHMPGVDAKCKDGARFFWPCTDVVFYRAGERLDWQPYREPTPPRARMAPVPRVVPDWIVREAKKAGPGTRNTTAFGLACRLVERGFSTTEIVHILGSYIDLDGRELNRTVLSAFKNTKNLAPE